MPKVTLIQVIATGVSALVTVTGMLLNLVGGDLLSAGMKPVVLYITIVGLVVLFALLLLWAAAYVKRMWEEKRHRKFSGLRCERCSDDDIARIAATARDLFGGTSTDDQQTQRLHKMDKRMFQVIKNRDGKFCGYMCLIRLSQAGVRALDRNDFNVIGLPREYVRNDRKRDAIPVYIGAVYGRNAIVKGYAILRLRAHLEEIRPTFIYARAASGDGLRLLVEEGFTTVGNVEPEIGRLFVMRSKSDVAQGPSAQTLFG